MPFRKLSHIPTSSAQLPTEYSYTETKEGVFERVVKTPTKLPPCENFALGKMIDAGVNLEKVSTKIRSSVPSANLFTQKVEEKEDEKSE